MISPGALNVCGDELWWSFKIKYFIPRKLFVFVLKYFMFTQNFRISEIQNTWLDQFTYTTEEYVTNSSTNYSPLK